MSNLQKTIRYFKRNGIANTYYAMKERLLETKGVPYDYVIPSVEELKEQSNLSKDASVLFSIVVPVYETPEQFLRELIECCVNQSYSKWELILADASKTEGPAEIIGTYKDSRIRYIKLEKNGGISENTNAAIEFAEGKYVALLDHDDLLTPDALYEVYSAIIDAGMWGIVPSFIYSDEDKFDGNTYFEPNIKPKFNLDYLLSNNYICHLSVIRRDILEEYRFRPEFDGAQDHDLFVRILGGLAKEGRDAEIIHIEKVLYHWRFHNASTSANPSSKDYAYEAGLKCVEDFTGVPVRHSLHRGFYVPEYGKSLFVKRPDIGAVGGPITDGNKITGGIYNERGKCDFLNLDKHFSGYLHRAHCIQDAYALDLLDLTPNPALQSLYAECIYKLQNELKKVKSSETAVKSEAVIRWSLVFARRAHDKGYRFLYDPSYKKGATDYEYLENGSDKVPVSVVIPNYNGKEYLEDCLKSVLASKLAPAEIIVVDNGSKDGSAENAKRNYPEVIFIEHSENLGFTGAVNHGIISSSQPYVFLLNNDTSIESDCIEKLYQAMAADSKLFSAGALMLSMDCPEKVDNAGDSYNLLGYARSFATGKSKFNYNVDKISKVFTSCAGAALYRKNVFNEIGLFDDRHFAYLEDVDIGYRARIFGYGNVNVGNAVVYHKGSAVSGSRHNEFKVSLSSRNAVFVAMKNQPVLQYLLNFPFILAGRLIKALFFTLKGLGKPYIKGTFSGIGMSLSKEGLRHHVKFKPKNLFHYIKIQFWIIGSTFKFK